MPMFNQFCKGKKMSIKIKVIIGVVVVLFLGAIGLLFVTNQSYKKNIDLIAKKTLANAKESFINLQKNDYKMMSVVIEQIVKRPDLKAAFVAKDRNRLVSLIQPEYDKYKTQYGITQYNFYEPGDTVRLFLAMSNTGKFGQSIDFDRKTLYDVVKSNQMSQGLELGTQGYAIRVTVPYYDSDKLIGYFGLGEEINKFCSVLKELTGNEFGMILQKKYLKPKDWETTRASLKMRNNWDDNKDLVVATSTIEDETYMKYEKNFDSIPDDGVILGEVVKDGKTFVKGVFPILDVNKHKAGGIFFLQNISDVNSEMASTRNFMQTIVICFVLILMLVQLVFKRLANISDRITRVVGGDFHTELVVKSNDEIGRFELLFEQYRQVFVDLLKQLGDNDK
jgi:methyl-accepting chemotaxis protein